MKYHSGAERWEFEPEPMFLYTQAIFEDEGKYFYTQVHEHTSSLGDLPINPSDLIEIPLEHISPLLEDGLTQCPDPEKSQAYIKRPRLSGYDGSPSLGSNILREARICQELLGNEHPNVARYFGCVEKNGRITGLVFQQYFETLTERLRQGRCVDKERCVDQIEAGLRHLHGLNLVHNDINGDNVMFVDRHNDDLVIIDFDSCAYQGSSLPTKRGCVVDSVSTAEFDNDTLGLQKLRAELGM